MERRLMETWDGFNLATVRWEAIDWELITPPLASFTLEQLNFYAQVLGRVISGRRFR